MEFARKFIEILEIDLDRCLNTYGSSAGGSTCTASGAPGTECYNTFGTCQDKLHYVKGTKTYKFCSRGAPIPAGEALRPYLEDVTSSPTEVKPEAGLAQRATTTVKLVDEPDSDVEQDPYRRHRTSAVQGTFWLRLLARNYNYGGRAARLRRVYRTGTVWDWSAFTTELYIIDSIKGPSGKGEISVTLKDPIKIADRIMVPTPTSGKLAAVFGTNDLSLTLGSGQGAQYPASGYVRHKGQVIQYTANAGDVLSWPSSTYRSQFNTTAMVGAIGEAVQLCRVWIGAPITTVLHDILTDAGILDTNIDLAGFEVEEKNWLGARYYITACISQPEDGSTLLAELCKQSNAVMWWSPTEQKVKYRVIGPRSPADTVAQSVTDEANLIEDSVAVQSLDQLRITFAVMNYNLETATSNRDEAKNYLAGEIYVDTDAEGENEYNDRRLKSENSRWFGADNAQAMKTRVSRQIAYYRDAPKQIDFLLDAKDAAIREADLYDFESKQIVDKTGAPALQRVLIVKRQDDGKGRIKITARTTVFNRHYGFIAPAGHPNYGDANDAERAYGFICNSSGFMSNGDEGSLII